MALPTSSPAPVPSPQLIGNAFVHQYYQILHQHPEQVHKFYQDSSILSRADVDGVAASVTTIQAINDKILSWDFSNCFTEIETVDSQSSYREGVLIVVTGSFTARAIKRKFTQSFYLAPQDNGGYFVLNDVFRLFKEAEPVETLVNGTNHDAPEAPLTPEPEPTSQENHIEEAPLSEGDAENKDEISDTTKNVNSVVEVEAVVAGSEKASQNHEQPVHETVASVAQDEAPKKSYASILKVTNGSPQSKNLVYVPTVKTGATPLTDKPVAKASAPADAIVTNRNAAPEKNNSREEESYSIYIRNLPVDATPSEVEQEFKKFGTIKPGCIQVRNHKIDNFCFGFIEFASAESMEAAIEASPMEIRGYTVHVEQKRTATRVVNGVVTYNGNGYSGRGHYQQGGRNGFRNDNFRGRGNLGANIGYGRNDFRGRINYGRGRGFQQRVYQNGNGNGRVAPGSNGEPKEIAVVA